MVLFKFMGIVSEVNCFTSRRDLKGGAMFLFAKQGKNREPGPVARGLTRCYLCLCAAEIFVLAQTFFCARLVNLSKHEKRKR